MQRCIGAQLGRTTAGHVRLVARAGITNRAAHVAHDAGCARPEAPAAIATDRIMIKPGVASITYLPDARWSDELPLVIQSLLIRSISGTGRIGYVGRSDGGPVPDSALLVRIDAFNVNALPDGTFTVEVDLTLTIVDDSDQRVTATQRFSTNAPLASDTPVSIVSAFQGLLDGLLPQMADWAVKRA